MDAPPPRRAPADGYPPELAAATVRLVQAPEAFSQADLAAVLGGLRRYLRRSAPSLSADQAEDVSMAAVLRLLEAAGQGRLDTSGNPAGYLVRIARNIAVSAHRSAQERASTPPHRVSLDAVPVRELPADDNVARRFAAHADAEIIRSAMATAYAQGDHTVLRVITFTLDALHQDGALPSNRAVAQQLGLSHTGVAKALARFSGYLTEIEGR